MEYCQRLQNDRAGMRRCRTQNSRWQGEESGMSSVRTSKRKDRRRLVGSGPLLRMAGVLVPFRYYISVKDKLNNGHPQCILQLVENALWVSIKLTYSI